MIFLLMRRTRRQWMVQPGGWAYREADLQQIIYEMKAHCIGLTELGPIETEKRDTTNPSPIFRQVTAR